MKKITLSDKFRLTDRFMEGRLSLVVDAAVLPDGKASVVRDGRYWVFSDGERVHCRFSEGDSLPVVMSYERAGLDPSVFGGMPGWKDARRADARYLPHRLVVEKVRCVRVRELGEGDVLRAGIVRNSGGMYMAGGRCGGMDRDWRRMYASLFWQTFGVRYERNPWVVVYEMTPVLARCL